MKRKLALPILVSAVVLLPILRGIQYMTVMDESGFYLTDTPMQKLLAYSVYLLIGLAVALSFALRLGKENKLPCKCKPYAGRLTAVASGLGAGGLATYAVLIFMSGNADRLTGICAVIAVLAAVYFVLLGLSCCGKSVWIMQVVAIFALAYPCLRAIAIFVENFRAIKASENVVNSIACCAMILLMIAITKLYMNFNEKIGKARQWTFVYAILGALVGPGRLIGLCVRPDLFSAEGVMLQTIAEIIVDSTMWVMALLLFVQVIRPVSAQPEQPEEVAGSENAEDILQ